ncbi:MAG: HDIG domain-containing protein, partial [Desulfobacterales bacterium]|nr:HDIG domain-containing protein [Desulfobacterales bacterium]
MFENRYEMLVYFLLTCTMAAYWTQNFRERKGFIKAGLKLGLLNIVFATAVGFLIADFSFVHMMWSWVFAFIGGIGVGILTAGLAPLVEVAFDYTTDIKLLELANLDQPILKRLMIEAPGTYHHSVIIGTMVEAVASEIGENPLLAKVCGYYHDIGKMNTPLYFIENQRDGKNRHDKLAPSMSKRILVAHVKEGVDIAKNNKLGQAIIDTISQHHGTGVISFFYEKAKLLEEEKQKRSQKGKLKQQKTENPVNISDFRYPGPKPQNRIAGLVMLADIVEAASRTLDNPTPSRLQGVVQNLINRVFSDGQLDNCELTLRDLNKIAKSFNNILSAVHHHRVEYAETPTVNNGKDKNGSSDYQPAKKAQDKQEKNAKNSTGHLKRLGLS